VCVRGSEAQLEQLLEQLLEQVAALEQVATVQN
jgi:hypothetical protein